MSSLHAQLLLVYAASACAALGGWCAPIAAPRARPEHGGTREDRRSWVARDELLVCALSVGLALAIRRDWPIALSLATLFPSCYLTFKGWQNADAPPRSACAAACLGAAWFLLSTSQSFHASAIAAAIGGIGPRSVLWISERTNRYFGLMLVVSATLFQLTRIPILLAS
jgi:hypothetical protein